MTQDTNIENLIINKLTKAQYESIANPDPAQLYFITDEVISSSDVVNALGYTPENVANKTTTLSSSSTDTQYPSAKAVYDQIANIDTLPSQTGQSGKFLTTDGTDASWGNLPVTTDLNGKADTDLTNVTDTGYIKMAGAGMPSNRYIDLTLGASGSTYTAPADGWIFWSGNLTATNSYIRLRNNSAIFIRSVLCGNGVNNIWGLYLPCKKGDIVDVTHSNITSTIDFRFIYAVGSESEAQ